MARKSGLGKGLSALIPNNISPEGDGSSDGSSTFVPIEKINVNPLQPRNIIINTSLEELASSIKEHGILQPLLVTHDKSNNKYILIAGERRLRAAKLAGLEAVPILEIQATEVQRLELALIENVQRADLTPPETARAYRKLNEDFGLSQEDIATRVGKNRATISNTIRLLKLPESVLSELDNYKISEGHARALLRLNSVDVQESTLKTIIENDFSVRQTEDLVREINNKQDPETQIATVTKTRKPKQADPNIKLIEDRIRTRLGTKVSLRHSSDGDTLEGKLIIEYYSEEELNSIMSAILGE